MSEVKSVLPGLEIPDTFDSKKVGALINELHDRVMKELLENEELIETLRSKSTPVIEKSLEAL